MKKQAYTMIAMIVLVGSMAVAAKAQTGSRAELIANIPFQFNVGNKTLPAGEYRVLSVSAESANVVVTIQRQDGKASAMLQMRSVEGKAQSPAHLIFNRYGNQYFFAQAWIGAKMGREASKSSAERAAQRELAGMKAKTEAVALRNR